MTYVVFFFTFAFRNLQNNSEMNEQIKEYQQKTDFKAYYEGLKKQPSELRDLICDKLGISTETFYVRLRSNSFGYPQQVVISQILERPINELFPEL